MKWSFPLGRISGIPVYVHATFTLLLAWIGFVHWTSSGSAAAVVSGIVFTLALFGCVLLHELGHALAARRYGIRTRDITLLPIGGVARLERMPKRPIQELGVALAGPAVNLVIAAALLVWLLATASLEPVGTLGIASGSFIERLMVVNLILVLFNLIPAFPMDGGRVLRAVLAMRMEYVRATRIAATVGQSAALLFGLVGIFTNPFLVLIALFVWMGAAQESGAVQTRSALGGVPVHAAMIRDYRTLSPTDPLGSAVELVLAGSQKDFPLLDQGRLVGVLTQKSLLEILARDGCRARVDGASEPARVIVDPGEMLDVAMERMHAAGSTMAPVVDGGRTIGLLTLENVVEFLSFRRALKDRAAPPSGTSRLLFLSLESSTVAGEGR